MRIDTKLPTLLVVAISACSSLPAPSREELAAADYGPRPADFEATIRSMMEMRLIDPTSALYRLNEPEKAWRRYSRVVYGWRVCGYINAKNRLGGYTGWQPLYAFWQPQGVPDIQTGSEASELCADGTMR